MDVKAGFSQDYAAHMRGLWLDRILLDYFDRAVADDPGKTAIVAHHATENRSTVLTYRDLQSRVRSIAAGLRRLGVRPGDVVSFQLPNWWEFTALHLACLQLGAVTNPLMPIFRERELEFMLGLAGSKVLVVPQRFRGYDFEAMAEGLRPKLPALRHVIVVGGEGIASFERSLLGKPADTSFATECPAPDDVVQLIYTSGTTGEPKGAMHTSNTLLSNLVAFANRLGLGREDVIFMASPMAHQTGFMYGSMMHIYLGATGVYQDAWDPALAADLMERYEVTFTMGSTPFLSDLTAVADHRSGFARSLRVFVAGGAPIPRPLVRRAVERLKAKVLSAWGMTENGAITLTEPNAAAEKVFETDGLPLPGVELRIIDADGAVLAIGSEGRLQARACSMFAGYYQRAHLNGLDPAGWFDTGDLARLDVDGYVRITGRAKDIIIRGGENVPVVEIENLLFGHPDVEEVAIVAMPDDRLGERACAFMVTRGNKPLDLAEVIAYLDAQKVSRSYMPERVEVLEAFPRTPSGKIQEVQAAGTRPAPERGFQRP